MPESLFRGHWVRSAVAAGVAAIVAHMTARLIPGSFHILTHSVVTLIALGALATVVMLHHRKEGQVLTESQEEFILIGVFGLFWLGGCLSLHKIVER